MKRAGNRLSKRRKYLFLDRLEERRVMAVWIGTGGTNGNGGLALANKS